MSWVWWCDPNNHCRPSRARPRLRLVYHPKVAQLSSKSCYFFFSKSCYLFALGCIFHGCLVPAAVLLLSSPVLSSVLAVPVAGDTHWHFWVSRQCALLHSVPVATVRAGTETGQAWLVLPWQCWGDSERSYGSQQCHNKHFFPEVLLGGLFHKLHLSPCSFPWVLVCSSAKVSSGRMGMFEAWLVLIQGTSKGRSQGMKVGTSALFTLMLPQSLCTSDFWISQNNFIKCEGGL